MRIQSLIRWLTPACLLVAAAVSVSGAAPETGSTNTTVDDVRLIRSDISTGFSHGGWNRDRYPELEPLAAHKTITVADLKGPGIIKCIHTTRHNPKEILARGIVLEIRFDDAPEPAVLCPLADFFGDGCNGGSTYFSSLLIECAPWSYNCYFQMPFKQRARVMLRNETDRDAMNYSYVEWEPLTAWKEEYGYFHATYRRQCFQLTNDTDQTFFEVTGAGNLIGRQFSIITDEPTFKKFMYVMEGNNEVDIDGRERALDYLGTEDSFGFSWGFQNTFIGLRSGMTLVQTGEQLNRLSIHRFYDHMPIRFARTLRWHINWSYEYPFHNDPGWAKAHAQALARNGCWVDYATVHYWYQNQPGGYRHEPLPSVQERRKVMLNPNTREDSDHVEK